MNKSKNRHIKSKKQRTWTDLRIEINKLCEQLDIPRKDFSEVNINSWKGIMDKVWARFSTKLNSRWIWETMAEPYTTMKLHNETLNLMELIDTTENVWCILNESKNEKSKFWIYEGRINSIDKIFWQTIYTDEIIIVSKKYEWLLILNHHDTIIGTGKIKDKILKLKK